ncbi:MAG TPA: rod shape-determining protein MreC [Holophaga sp.]|nr:rod shape-determining protein MreC [Holophaga sp.]
MKRRRWWSPAARRRWAIALLFAGHLVWVAVGSVPRDRWERWTASLSAPGRSLSGWFEGWQARRNQRVRDLGRARAEVDHLRREVEALRLEAQRQAPRRVEAEEAVRLLGLQRQVPLETTGARVVADLRRASFGGLILDRGSEAGFVADQGVICPEGVVGRLWAVAPGQASVLPVDAHNASVGVMLARSRATGVLQGTGPGRAAVRYVGPQEVVQVGEPVLTSGLDRVFPRGLLVGHVTAVRPRERELALEVALAAPLDKIHLVLLLPPKPPIQVEPPPPPPETETQEAP